MSTLAIFNPMARAERVPAGDSFEAARRGVVRVNGRDVDCPGGCGTFFEAQAAAGRFAAGGTIRRRLFRPVRFALMIGFALARRRRAVVLASEGVIWGTEILALAVGRAGADGRMEAGLVRAPCSRLAALRLLLKMRSCDPRGIVNAYTWRTERLTIESATPLAYFGGGREAARATRFEIRSAA